MSCADHVAEGDSAVTGSVAFPGPDEEMSVPAEADRYRLAPGAVKLVPTGRTHDDVRMHAHLAKLQA